MKYGYVRSARPEGEENQIQMLKQYGVDKLYIDICSGHQKKRELKKLMSIINKDDILVVCSIDRLSRDIKDIIKIKKRLDSKNTGLKILNGDENGIKMLDDSIIKELIK